jgi:hypothetical protein
MWPACLFHFFPRMCQDHIQSLPLPWPHYIQGLFHISHLPGLYEDLLLLYRLFCFLQQPSAPERGRGLFGLGFSPWPLDSVQLHS